MAPPGAVAVFTALLIASAICQGVIIGHPSDATVFSDHEAVFTCVVDGAPLFITWNTHRTNPRDPQISGNISQRTVGGNEESTLVIQGRAQYNGTKVECVVRDRGGETKSQNGTLIIQGPLSSVGHLKTSSSTSSITISWTAPFSLHVTDGDPKVYYSVLIYNVTDETAVSVPHPNCMNISETFCVFKPDPLSPCHKFNFTVVPYNGAGQGNSSQNVSEKGISYGSPRIKFTGPEISAVNNGSKCNVTFLVSGDIASVCKYTLPVVDVMDGTIFMPETTVLEDGGFISYTLPANRRYSTAFEVETATRTMENINFTTFDIQNSRAEQNSSAVAVTVEFITDSLAKGCLIALQCNDSTADKYRAIMRNGSKQTLTESISVPSCTYTVYIYAIEDDGLPYKIPVNIPENGITITTNYSEPTPSSAILDRANISVNGSQVTIDCEFVDECPLTSCVLIYREYNTPTLNVIDYNPTTTVFPVTVTVDQPENFTFAIFGRNCEGELEEKPAMSLKLATTVTTPPDDSPQAESDADIAPVVAGTVPVALLMMVVGLTVTMVLVKKKRGRIVKQCDVEGSPNCRPDCGRENSNVMLHDEEEEEIKSESGTLSGSAMMMATEKEEDSKYPPVAIAALKNQPQPSLDQAVQYQGIDFKKTKRAAHPHGLYYSDVVPPPSYSQGRNRIIEVDSTLTPYATVLPHATTPTDSSLSGFSTGSEERGGNGSSEFVGDGFGQAKDTSKEDESRGTQISVSDEGVGEQHGAGVVTQANAILDEEEATDDNIDMTTSCVSEEESGNTESESSTSEECTSDEDDTVTLALLGANHHLSSSHMRNHTGCFEAPPLPLQGVCKVVTTSLEEEESFLTVCRQRLKSDIHGVMVMVVQLNSEPEENSKASDRKVHSDAGPAAVLPLPCTSFPAADDTAVHRAGKSETIFNHSPGDEELTQTRSIQSTGTSADRRQLIASSLFLRYTDEGISIVTGGMYTRPCPKVMHCDSTSPTATEMPPVDVMVEDAHLQQPPLTTPPSQQQQPKKKPPRVPGGNYRQIAKVDPPFKKYQWNDPPDNYQEEMERWTHTGVALGFHGPRNELIHSGRNSHFG